MPSSFCAPMPLLTRPRPAAATVSPSTVPEGSIPRRARAIARDVATAAPAGADRLSGVLTRVDPAITGTADRPARRAGRRSPEAQDTAAGGVLGGTSRCSGPSARRGRLRLRRISGRIAIVVVRGARQAAAMGSLAAGPAARGSRALATVGVGRRRYVAVLAIRVARVPARRAVARGGRGASRSGRSLRIRIET